MKIALGCDHGALALKTALIPHLEKKGYEVKVVKMDNKGKTPYNRYYISKEVEQ